MTRLSIITTATRGLCRHLSATASCAVIVDHLTLVEATNHSNSTYVSRDAKFLMEYRSIYNSVAYNSPQTSLARFYICAVAQLERPQPSDTHLPRYQHWTSDFLPRGYLGACSWADRPTIGSFQRTIEKGVAFAFEDMLETGATFEFSVGPTYQLT